jgi:hypothetical protein
MVEEKVMQEKVMQGTVNKYITAGSSKPKWRYRLRLGRDPITGVYLREGREDSRRKARHGRLCVIESQKLREGRMRRWLRRHRRKSL